MRIPVLLGALLASSLMAQDGNPIITSQYTADPSARVFNDRLYLYPSHDRDDAKWWDMTDWHVFSSDDLATWTDHGVVLDLARIPYAKRFAWAPDCAARNGKYYFVFPVSENLDGNTDRIGVAVGDRPEGPFTPQPTPLVSGYPQAFDPCVFTDDDGTCYLLCGQREMSVARFNSDMVSLAEPLRKIEGAKGFFEGAWMHKYQGRYYLSYSAGETIDYAIGNSPYGPFVHQGALLGNIPAKANTTHHSIVCYRGEWLLFYHSRKLAEDRRADYPDHKRSVCIDRLRYREDGTIEPVVPTLTGVKPLTR